MNRILSDKEVQPGEKLGQRLRLRQPSLLKAGIALLLLTTLPSLCFAHSKTDVVTLKNGDRITGEIQTMQQGRLKLNTDAMGSIYIEWEDVASLSSDFNYEVRLVTGARHFGRLDPGPTPQLLALEGVVGVRHLQSEDVVDIRSVEESFQDRLDVYISANYAFTKASGVTQTEFRGEASYEDKQSLNAATVRATVSDTEEQTTTSSRLTLSRQKWTDRESMFRSTFGGYESNDELDLDYRLTLGLGVGKYLVDTNSNSFVAGIGAQVLEERTNSGVSTESAELVLRVGYGKWHFDSPELDLRLRASLYPSLTESKRLRADTSATLRWQIIGDLFWDISTWSTYDNSVSAEADSGFDWGLTTGLGWSF